MIKDITFEEVPAFAVVEKRIQTIIPNAEIVETQLDEAPFHFLFHIQFTKRTTLRLSKELMDDLPGKNDDHRKAQLAQAIRDLVWRSK
jgi:hypothetical protein